MIKAAPFDIQLGNVSRKLIYAAIARSFAAAFFIVVASKV